MSPIKAALSVLATAVTATALIGAITLMSGSSGGGFFPGLGIAFAILILGIGNVLVLVFNGIYWLRYGASTWLKVVVVIQVLPALGCLWMIGQPVYSYLKDSRAQTQRSQVYDAIRADDPDQLVTAQAACGSDCTEGYSRNEQLLDATNTGSLRVVAELIKMAAHVTSGLGTPNTDLHTCEGLYFPSMDALSVAIVQGNIAIVQLLLPVSDEGSRRQALWTAANADQLEIVKLLVKSGVPLDIRGEILNSNNTLLVAAAEGAAMRVGQWLIESQHMPVNAMDGPDPYPGTPPVSALLEFVQSIGSTPRTASFLEMLVKHGADLNVSRSSGGNWLATAVLTKNKKMAQLLLRSGASSDSLDAPQSKALSELLAKDDAELDSPYKREGCIEVGSTP